MMMMLKILVSKFIYDSYLVYQGLCFIYEPKQ